MTIDNRFDKFMKKLDINNSIFIPNLTSKLSVIAATKNIGKKKEVLDLGCGSGIIGAFLFKEFKNINLYCSDVHKSAVLKTKKNFNKLKINSVVKCGNLFDPWKNKKFDYIINDVSAISENIARLSPWFKNNIPCKTGKDGTRLTIEVINKSTLYLHKNGSLQIPILNLSNSNKIIKHAKRKFKKVSFVIKKDWFLPDIMYKLKKNLYKLKKSKHIQFEEKFGKIICSTSILICSKPYEN